jgi:hypothetical protein
MGVLEWLKMYKTTILGLVALAVVIASFATGFNVGRGLTEGQYAKEEVTRLNVEATVAKSVAEALSKQRPINQYRTQVLQREVVRVPDYSRCKHSDVAFGLLNDAIAGRPIASRDLILPEGDGAAGGQLIRGNDDEAAGVHPDVQQLPSSDRSQK